LNYLRTILITRLTSDLSSTSYDPQGSEQTAGYDMTASFVHTMETFCLAQAQECFWQRAMGEKYTNGVIAKLAAKVRGAWDGIGRGRIKEIWLTMTVSLSGL
jgi:programmed cell death 6-interacting protein